MSTTLTPHRHLELVHDHDHPTERQRDLVIAGVAREQGWAGSLDEQTRRRRALRHACPRSSCRAEVARQCRRWFRGRWRPLDAPHDERQELDDNDPDLC